MGGTANSRYMPTHFIIQKEMISFLQDRKKLNESVSTNKDRFDHFGKFVACTLRDQPQEISSTVIKEITNIMLRNFTTEINPLTDS